MREKNFQNLFSDWAKRNKNYITQKYGSAIVFELKICKTKSIRFDALREHQVRALLDAKGAGCYHKINDMPFIKNNPKMRFTNKKPFDCFLISKASAYVVVWFYKRGQRKGKREMILVDITKWLKTEKIAKKKSIRAEELKNIGDIECF